MSSVPVNPIIPGFSPDPSIVLVDGTFYLVTSTFHLFPGLPIYVSKDLVSWTHIGNAINRRTQLSLKNSSTKFFPPDSRGDVMLSTGGLYAPTVRHHAGTFYIVCTNVIHTTHPDTKDRPENFILTTTDIHANNWSDPIPFDFRGIDPSIFFNDDGDGDGRAYIQASASPGPMTTITQFEINPATGEKLSAEKILWTGTGDIYPEGPHLYKKDGWYYLMISEGGTFDGHMVTVARSRDLWGPYESYEHNPILTARDTEEYIQATGHCDVFQDLRGRWWGVCLGTRKREGRYVLGRETFLTTAEWKEGDWPVLDQVRLDPNPNDGSLLARKEDLRTEPGVDYLYIRDPELDHYSFSDDDNGTITLTASAADISQWQDPTTFIGKRQRKHDGIAKVTLHNPQPTPAATTTTTTLKAGLAYYKDEHRHIKLFHDFSTSEIVLELTNNAKSISRTVRHGLGQQEMTTNDAVTFRVEYTEVEYRFSFSMGGDEDEDVARSWVVVGCVDALEMTGPDFVGPVIGVFATAREEGVRAKFEGLGVE
ncbi:hypothetical protein FQN50_002263 [Emmonsiellopsis sp. PD_5]|nr:hypothetical protein FQN50_002263 [Emmonsiellopsis sp. PD_5]